jgi:hypothetical protein
LFTEIDCDAPLPSVPVSKLCPSSAVAVCEVLSWLVTATPPPCLTVTLAGENLKLLIFTALALPPDAGCDDDPLEFAEGLGLLPPPQPANSRAVPAMTTSELMAWRTFTAISVRL